MTNRYSIFFLLLLLVCYDLSGQTKILYGKIQNLEETEGIHILNTRSHMNTITNREGAFQMNVRLYDTLVVSSIKYIPEQLIVDEATFLSGKVTLELELLVTELDEVYLFPKLTGDLERDIKKIKVVDTLNFDDVGIPGFKGKPQEKIPKVLGQVITPTSVNIEALYKHLSGYYKTLRTKRKWEAENVVAAQVMHHYTQEYFQEVYGIPENRLYDFVLFCIETSDLQSAFSHEKHGKVHDIFHGKSMLYLNRIKDYEEE